MVNNLLDQTLRLEESDGRSSEGSVDLERAKRKEEERSGRVSEEGKWKEGSIEETVTYLHSVDEDRLAKRRRWKEGKERKVSSRLPRHSRITSQARNF